MARSIRMCVKIHSACFDVQIAPIWPIIFVLCLFEISKWYIPLDLFYRLLAICLNVPRVVLVIPELAADEQFLPGGNAMNWLRKFFCP